MKTSKLNVARRRMHHANSNAREMQFALANMRNQREAAWAELRAIRRAINANPGESTLDEVNRIVHELTRVRDAWNAACAFIAANVGDPDISAEMRRTYAEFQRQRALLEVAPDAACVQQKAENETQPILWLTDETEGGAA